MVVFNPSKREIGAKIVYYGPAAGGKTTNLQFIHNRLNPKQRGDLISLATKDDRTLFFDFLPLDLGTVKGFNVRFHLYTVPGQVYYVSTRRAVLTGVDGIVFVADSQEEKLAENIESLEDLEKNLLYYGKKIDDIPMILQYNKRDLKKISSIQTLNSKLNRRNLSVVESVGLNGKGVMETLTDISRAVLENLEDSSKKPKAKPVHSSPLTPGATKTPPPLPKSDVESLIELESEEKVFDIERLRAERRATIDRLLKQKEEAKAQSEPVDLKTTKGAEKFDSENVIGTGETEAIDQEFTEEDFGNELDISEEGFEFNGITDDMPISTEPYLKREEAKEKFVNEIDLLESKEEDKGISLETQGTTDFDVEENKTGIEEIPLDLEESPEWIELETEESPGTAQGDKDFRDEAQFLQREDLTNDGRKELSTTGRIEIISCGAPEKILPASIKLPITLQLGNVNKKAKLTITIHLEELI
jgi:signal recognition particle receptor subunit beta